MTLKRIERHLSHLSIVMVVIVPRRGNLLLDIVVFSGEALEKVIWLRGIRIFADRRALLSCHLFLWVLDTTELSCRVVDVVVDDSALIVLALVRLLHDGLLSVLSLILNDEDFVEGLDYELPTMHLAQVVLVHLDLLVGAAGSYDPGRQIVVADVLQSRCLRLKRALRLQLKSVFVLVCALSSELVVL